MGADWVLRERDGFKSVGERSNLEHFRGDRKLNLGCGVAREPSWKGWVNVDINHRVSPDVVFDARLRWPIKDEAFHTILCYQTLQFFAPGEELFHVFSESYRVLKPGCFFIGAVQEGHNGSPMQKSIWSERTPHLLCKSVYYTNELITTGWEADMPVRDWILLGVEKPDLIWFVLRRPGA